MKKLLYFLIAILLLTSCKKEQHKLSVLQGKAFGTYYIIKADNTTNTKDIEKGIDSIINTINKSLSTYIPTSDISKINKGDSTVVTDALFQEMFRLSGRINKESDGYFDPTIGNLRNAYGFGDTKPLNNISDAQLDSMMQYVGWQKVQLLPNGTVKKQHPEIYFDFNAIAKGYAIDKIVEYLVLKSVKNLSVEVGGEVRTKGKHPIKNKIWTVGIESIDSKAEDRKIRANIQLNNKAIAGSGNYRKNRTDPVSSKKIVHTINPLTGKAEQGNILSAYVIANTCAEADAYATTFMAMDIEKSKIMLSKLEKIDAYLVYSDVNGNTKAFVTSGFEEKILK